LSSVDPRNPSAAHGKWEWVKEHLGEKYAMRLICTKKKYVAAGPTRILLDDNRLHCTAWHQWGGKAILFPQPWTTTWSPDYANGGRIAYTRGKLEHYTQKINDES